MKPFRLLPHDIAAKITDSRLDLTCLIEYGEPVPVLFETLKGLRDWARVNRLTVKPAYEEGSNNSIRIFGWHPLRSINSVVHVDFIWARATWNGYRHVLTKRSKAAGYENGFPNDYHADHVVARSRLKNIPNAWTLLFEVPKQANTVFGSQIERKLKPFLPGFYQYNLTGLELLKLYCEAMPAEKVSTLDETIARVRGQFIPNNEYAQKFLDGMECAVRPFYVDV